MSYESLKAEGKCPRCQGAPPPGRVFCAVCVAGIRAWQATNRERYLATRRAHYRLASARARRTAATPIQEKR